MDGFKSLPKMKCGGSVDKAVKKCGGGAMKKGGKYKEGGDVDLQQDKALIKKAFRQHDKAEHGGKEATEIKLKHGGRSKKACGSVKKYKAGGAIEMKKSSGDLDTIKKIKATGAKKADAPSKASQRPNLKGSDVEKEKSKASAEKDLIKKVPPTGDKKAAAPSAGLKGEGNTPKKFKTGGKVKHFVGGGVTGLPTAAPAAVGLAGQGVVSDADRLLQQKILGQGPISDNERLLLQRLMQQKAGMQQSGLGSGMPINAVPPTAAPATQGPYTKQEIDAVLRSMAQKGMFSHTGD